MPTVSPPSLAERITRGGGYVCVGMGGVWVMLNPPETLGSALGYWLMWLWIGLMMTAIPCGIAAFLGRFRNEYVFLPFFVAALIIANWNLWSRVIETPDLGARAWTISGLILTLIARWFTLRRLVRIGEALGRHGYRWTGSHHYDD